MARNNREKGGCGCGGIAIVLLLAIIGFAAFAYWQIDRGTPQNVPGYEWLVSNLNAGSGDNPARQSAAAPAAPRPTATPRRTDTSLFADTPRAAAFAYNTQNIRWARQSHPDLYQSITRLPWASDGLDDADQTAIDEILYIAVKDAATAQALVAMPFLQTNDAASLHALESANDLLRDGNKTALHSSRIYQAGITNEWTPVVAAAGAVAPDAVAAYLDGLVSVRQESYETDYTPNLAVTIVRPAGSAAGGVAPGLIAQSVRLAENIMRMPLPTNNVIIVVDDRAATGGFSGTNHGFAIGLEQESETKSPERLLNILVHEVAHYWWHSNADWIDEGVADTIAATASTQQGHTFTAHPNRRQDCAAVNISEIGNAPRSYRGQFYCNYYLGEKLFRELQENAAPSDFIAGLQRLYQLSREQPAPQTRQDYRAGIPQVRAAFPDSADIINRHWSGDLNAPHRWDPDDNLAFTSHNAVVWTQKPTYDDGIVSFAGSLSGDASLVSPDASTARQFGGSSNFTINDASGNALGSILIPLTGGSYWTLDDPGDVIAEQYQIGGGNFAISFQWPDALGDYANKHITVWGYHNTERTPTINNRADPLGQSTVR